MTEVKIRQILEQLAIRNGMQRFDYFVGRTRALNRLAGVASQEQTTAGWVHGPRRSGKSSLARNLADQAHQQGSVVAYLDTSDVAPTDFDGLLDRIFEGLPAEFRPSGSGSSRNRLEFLARRSTERSILLVFDEFDHIALNLGTDEQALLRRLKEEYKHFCYLFATRLKPSLIVEDVSEERSRLLGVCTPERLGMLERREIHELCKRVAHDLGSADFERWYEVVWKTVGGLGAAVMGLIHALAVEQQENALNEARVEEVLEERREDIEVFLSGFWRDLQPGTRELLLDVGSSTIRDNKTSAKQDGFIDPTGAVVRPTWLIEIGKRLGRVPPEVQGGSSNRMAKVERLHTLMTALNANVKRQGESPVFVFTDEALHYFRLTRPVRNQDELKGAVDHLHKILLEGARSSAGTWRMPDDLLTAFKRSDAYNELVALRNFYDHDPDQRDDAERPSVRYQNIGEVFVRHCGQPNLDRPEQWARVRDGLIDRWVEDLSRIEELSRSLAGKQRSGAASG